MTCNPFLRCDFRQVAARLATASTSLVSLMLISIASLVSVGAASAAPTIAVEGSRRLVVDAGARVELGVSAQGSGVLKFRWLHNGLAVAGANGSELELTNVTDAQAGWYVADVTDDAGTTRSSPVFVLVSPTKTHVRGWDTNCVAQLDVPTDLDDAIAITAGWIHALALRRDGTVVGWGSNSYNQLDIPAGLDQVVAIATGSTHNLALKSDGTVVAWGGYPWSGQSSVPVGLSDVVQIFATNYQSVAIKSDGTMVSWGEDSAWRLNESPFALTNVAGLARGYSHTLVLFRDGTVRSWAFAQGEKNVPAGLQDVSEVAAVGYCSIALKRNGEVVVWGDVPAGSTPVPPAVHDVVHIDGMAAIRRDGSAFPWDLKGYGIRALPGDLSAVHRMAIGDYQTLALCDSTGDTVPLFSVQPVSQSVPEVSKCVLEVTASGGGAMNYQWRKGEVPIAGATTSRLVFDRVALGDAGSFDVVVTNYLGSRTSDSAVLTVNRIPVVTTHSAVRQVLEVGQSLDLVVTATGTGSLSYQWTRNGKPIDSANTNTFHRSAVSSDDDGYYLAMVTDDFGTRISRPMFVSVALPAGRAKSEAWGDNYHPPYYVGDFVLPSHWTDTIGFAAAATHILGLNRDGTVVGWGQNWYGEATIPNGLADVVAIAAADRRSLALKSDGSVVAWGGDGGGTIPTGLSDVVAIATGGHHSLALRSDGTVVGWGNNEWGAALVPSFDGRAIAIAASPSHSMALLADGSVIAWGDNSYGQATVPAGLAGVVAIAAGERHSVALKADGTVVCWGDSSKQQTAVPAGVAGITQIAAGSYQTLALKADGRVVVWGSGYEGDAQPRYVYSHVYSIFAGVFSSFLVRDSSFDAAPAIVASPADNEVDEGSRYVLSAKVAGTPLAYQWLKDGQYVQRYEGGQNAELVLGDFSAADVGSYSVRITNSLGSVTSGAARLAIKRKPFVITGPLGCTRYKHQTAELSVVAGGAGTLNYQWRRNGTAIAGATTALLRLADLSPADEGSYDVVVSNSVGSITSIPAVVEVSLLPYAIIHASHRHAVEPGSAVNLLVDVVAEGTVSCQWFHNGIAISDATSAGLAIPHASFDDSGYYSVQLTDNNGANWSDPFFVNVCPGRTQIRAWGAGTSQQKSIPAGLVDAVAISAGPDYGLALKRDGTVVGWPQGYSFQASVPDGVSDIVMLASGSEQVLALRADGTVTAWGYTTSGATAVPADLAQVVEIATGASHSLALKVDGSVVSWGRYQTVPSDVHDLIHIAAGWDHSVGLKRDGTVVVWGDNTFGQRSIPDGLNAVVAIAANANYSAALRADGTVAIWGDLGAGQAAVPSDLPKCQRLALGWWHVLALDESGLVHGWGANSSGQATPIADLKDVRMISASGSWSLALQAEETNFDVWRTMHFNAGELADPLISGASVVLGPDNSPNILKYALCVGPRDAISTDVQVLLPPGDSSGEWSLVYSRPSDRLDLVYSVEYSTDLTNWTSVGVRHERNGSAGADAMETWSGQIVSFTPRVFFRLKVAKR